MTCYICGDPATRRLSPDLDIRGVELCDDENCRMLLDAGMMMDDGVEFLERMRKTRHKEKGRKVS